MPHSHQGLNTFKSCDTVIRKLFLVPTVSITTGFNCSLITYLLILAVTPILGRCLLLLLRIRSAHFEILGYPMGGGY